MAAKIRTYLNGDLSTVVEGASRNDLRPGDVVTVESIGTPAAVENRWTLAFTPDALDGSPSAATLADELGHMTTFVADNEGAYLLRLVTDPHTPHESVQFVRLRVLTKFGSLKLVAAGERRDGTGIIPVDVSTEGWANDQNYNLQELLKHISRSAISSCVLYVDSNRGHDYSNAQNTEEAEGYGDFSKIQDAIDHAVAGGHCGVPASPDHPWVIIIRPGRYVESLKVPDGVHLVGEPTGSSPVANIESNGSSHVFTLTSSSAIMGLRFHNNDNVLGAEDGMLHVTGGGTLHIKDCTLDQQAAGADSGPCLSVDDSTVIGHDSTIYNANTTNETRYAIHLLTKGRLELVDCSVRGESGVLGGSRSSFSARHTTIKSSAENAGSYAIRSIGFVSITGGGVYSDDSSLVAISMQGSVLPMSLRLTNTLVSGKLHFDKGSAFSHSATLSSVAIKPEDITFLPSEADCKVTHGTAGESIAYWADKEVHSSSFKVGSIPADSVQEALDRILNLSLGVVNLSDAYNGIIDHTTEPFVRGDGAGNRIVADAIDADGVGIPVQITHKKFPGGPLIKGNTKGRLQVVSNVEVGAINAPEINLDPNPTGVGPVITLGETVFPGGGHFPVGAIVGNADPDSGFIYNVRVQTQASHNDSGSVIIEAGDSLPSDAPAGDGGSVHIAAGYGGVGGDITLWPSDGDAANGRVVFQSGALSSLASLSAKNPFVGGEPGTLVLGTSFAPAVVVEVLAEDDLATVAAKITAASHKALVASDAGGVLHIEAQHSGPFTDVYLVSTSSGDLNQRLGDLTAGNATFSSTNLAQNQFLFQVSADNELSMGVDGAMGPMVYNADTGSLNVPGAISAESLVTTGDVTVGGDLSAVGISAETLETTGDVTVGGDLSAVGITAETVETTGDLVVGGDLTVLGDSTIAYTNTVKVEDKNLELGTIEGGGETDATADGGGITIKGDTDKTFIWDQATNAFSVNTNFTVPSGKIGVGLDGMASPEPQKTLYVHTENDGDGFLVENSHDGSKFLVDYSAGNGTNAQLFDDSNTRTVFFRSYGNSWFNAGNVGIGTESPSKLLHVETDGDGEGVFVGNTSNGSKFLIDYSMGNGINAQLYDETNTRTIFFRSYGNSWFSNTVSIGTDTPTAGKALTVEGDVKITGVLDPTALVITHEPSTPTAVAEGETAIWVDDEGTVKLLQHIAGEGSTVVDELAKVSSAGSSTLNHRIISDDADVADDDYFIGCDTSSDNFSVYLNPNIAVGRDLIIKNQGEGYVMIKIGQAGKGPWSGVPKFDDDSYIRLDAWEGVRIICNGGGSWSLV